LNVDKAHHRIAVHRASPEEDIIAHTEKEINADTYWINFHLLGNGTEWIDEGLPTPTYLEHLNKGYLIAWAIDGFFGTEKGTTYLNDIIARVMITFRELKPKRQCYKPLVEENSHYLPKIYKLQQLQNLKSLKKHIKAPVRADSFDDHVFWCIKLYCEDLIRNQGLATYGQLESFSYSNFNKEQSTLRAKCRSIFNYYESKNWQLPTKRKTKTNEELKVTRQERALLNAKEREEKAKRKVINAITGLMSETYKKKSGAWHIGKIAKDTNLTPKTVSKHIKAIESE